MFWVHAQGGAWVQNLRHVCLRPHYFKIDLWIIDLVYVLCTGPKFLSALSLILPVTLRSMSQT